MLRQMSVHREIWPAKAPFRITGRTFNDFHSLVVEIGEGGHIGRGEGMGVYYLDDTPEGMQAQVERVRAAIESGGGRQALRSLLPPGGARNAIDCALWDLEAQLADTSAWAMAGVKAQPIQTVYTIGIEDDPESMGERAAKAPYPLLKVKLDGDRSVERIEAIRRRRPDAGLVVDANQGWSFEQLRDIAGALQRLGVIFIEQPLKRGEDEQLEGYRSPLPLAADESCLHLGELEQAARRYQMVNIKLDKCGGLTEGLEMARAARALGLGLMVGSMGGSSMSMAPAHVLAQLCDYVDIDGPLLLKQDRLNGFSYEEGLVRSSSGGVCWGTGANRG